MNEMKTKLLKIVLLLMMIKWNVNAQPFANTETSNILINEQANHFTSLDTSLSYQMVLEGLKGYHNFLEKNDSPKPDYLTLIDFSKASSKERFYLLDMKTQTIVLKCLVAHGKNSGEFYATSFSNDSGSLQSSLGFYKTLKIYKGKHGTSLRLEGLENGWNDSARKRYIVIHSAPYVSFDWMRKNKINRIGRSWGCPAVPKEYLSIIINKIREGTCLYIYAANKKYSDASIFLK